MSDVCFRQNLQQIVTANKPKVSGSVWIVFAWVIDKWLYIAYHFERATKPLFKIACHSTAMVGPDQFGNCPSFNVESV